MKRKYLAAAFLACAALFYMLGLFYGRSTTHGVLTEKPVPAEAFEQRQTEHDDASQQSLVNLNTCSAADLQSLPNIGSKTAERIIAYRQAVGGFASKEQLLEVNGIGEKTYRELEELVYVE